MPTELLIPDIGENVTGGDVVRIMVAKVDTIKKDQPVIELVTDKATIEVPSDQEGTVTDIKVKQGDKVKIGQVILTLDNGASGKKTEDRIQKTEEEPNAQSPGPKAGSPESKALSHEPKEAQSETK